MSGVTASAPVPADALSAASAPTPTPMDTANAGHYVWGGVCDGWHLLADPALSVIQERVPPGAGEQTHRHHVAQQFFFILAGEAAITVEGRDVPLKAGQGLHVPAGVAHRFHNPGTMAVDFLVVSSPTTRGDRENLSP